MDIPCCDLLDLSMNLNAVLQTSDFLANICTLAVN